MTIVAPLDLETILLSAAGGTKLIGHPHPQTGRGRICDSPQNEHLVFRAV
jgi:hypothetical protein